MAILRWLTAAAFTGLLGCEGSGESNSASDDPGPEVEEMKEMMEAAEGEELTEPWKSMELPIDGAVVVASTSKTLALEFPTVPAADVKATHSTLTGSLEAAGWNVREDRQSPLDPTGFEAVLHTQNDREAHVVSGLERERPSVQIYILDQ